MVMSKTNMTTLSGPRHLRNDKKWIMSPQSVTINLHLLRRTISMAVWPKRNGDSVESERRSNDFGSDCRKWSENGKQRKRDWRH